jgi:hypothetical protein
VSRSRLANLLVATAAGILFLVGLFVHGVVGAVLLLAVVIFLGYLSSRAWPAIHPRGRGVRVIVLGAVVAVAVVKIVTR